MIPECIFIYCIYYVYASNGIEAYASGCPDLYYIILLKSLRLSRKNEGKCVEKRNL